MFCPSCGTQLSDDARFCGECGKPIPAYAGSSDSASMAADAIATGPISESVALEGTVREAAAETAPEFAAEAVAIPVAEATEQQPQEGNAKSKKSIIIAVIVAVAVIAIAAIIGYNMWSAEQQRIAEERQATVIALIGDLTEEANGIIPNTGETADRAVLLDEYMVLADARDAIVEAEQSGDLELADGSAYDVSSELADIDSKITQIHDWFAASYQAQLDGSSFPADADASSMSAADCQAKIDALTALLALVDSEKAVWGGQTGEGSAYAALVSAINAQVSKGNELLPAIAAREEEERKRAEEEAKANNFLGVWSVSYYGSTNWNFTEYNFKSGGTGTCTSRMVSNPITWRRGDLSNGKVHIYVTERDSSYSTELIYDVNNDTLSYTNGEQLTRDSSSIVDRVS